MKRKELLQHSAIVAAVVLAAAVMEPGNVRAAEISDTEVSVQNLDVNEQENAEQNTADEESTENTGETEEEAAPVEDTYENDSAKSASSPEGSEAETQDDTMSNSSSETETDLAEVNMQTQSAGWVTKDDGTTGYRKEDGTFCRHEIQEFDGKLYYFDSDETLVTGEEFWYNGSYYRASGDGSLYQNSWVDADGKNYYYGADGAAYRDGSYGIDGKRYYFDSHGALYKNIGIVRREKDADGNEIKVIYKAKENGELYTGWCWIYSNALYYFDETGRGYNGIKTVDGETYFFEEGRVCRKEVVQQDGKYYIAQSDATLLPMKNNDWTVSEGNTYYLKENQPLKYTVEKIGDAWYGFDGYGRRYENGWFDFWDDGAYTYYYAQKDGTLLVNSWTEKDHDTVYLGADGGTVRGLQIIDGKQYYFGGYYSALLTDQWISENGKTYYADSDGVLSEIPNKDGWVQKQGKWYYLENGAFLKDCVRKIGDKYYGFNDSGQMYADGGFWIWRSAPDNSYFYYADKDGHLKTNAWGTGGYANYYFGEDGAASYDGVHTINGKTYYFISGKMQTSGTIAEDGKNYVCREDGSLLLLSKAGWNYAEANWYYIQNGKILQNCIQKIDSSYYAFDADGKMQENTIFTFKEDGQEISCFAQKGGALLTDTSMGYGSATYYFDAEGKSCSGIQIIDGKQYYLVNGQKQKSQALEVDGAYYLSDSEGQLKKVEGKDGWNKLGSQWYYIKEHHFLRDTVQKIGDAYYGFSTDGWMYVNTFFDTDGYSKVDYYAKSDGTLLRNQWSYTPEGTKVFYGEDAKRVIGTYSFEEIDGKQYYFDGDGLLTNAAVSDKKINTNYAADGEGVLHVLENNQWTKVGDYWYYVENSNVVENRILNLGEAYYGFSEEGHLYVNTIFSIIDRGWPTITYFAEEDGKIRLSEDILDTWNKGYGCFTADDEGYTGMKTIQNVDYYFSKGKLLKNQAFSRDGVNYVAGADGRVLILPQNGWKQVDGRWYYVSDGQIMRNGTKEIDGNTYVFHSKGYMVSNNILICLDKNDHYHIYAADKSGKLIRNGWLQLPSYGKWMYFDKDGKSAYGLTSIQGKPYYFSGQELVTDAIVNTNNKTYIADKNGVLHTPAANGWTKVDHYWYYFVNGKEICDEIVKIGTAYYGFDSSGRMYNDTEFYYSKGAVSGYFRASSGGTLIFQNTVSVGDSSYSYDQNGKGLEGYQTIQGIQYYYINGRRAANTAFRDESGHYYAADANGNLQALSNNTWMKAGRYYYYVKDGVVLKDQIVRIDGKWYAFDSYGRMCTNQFFHSTYKNYEPEVDVPGTLGNFSMDPIVYRASSSGELLCNQWYEDATGKYYFDRNGVGYEGVHWIDGKRYTFSQGKVVESEAKASWKKDSKGWWYRHADGSYTKNGWEKIGGKYYLFNASGYMMTGWQKVKGTWYYLNADGTMVSKSWRKLGGKWYYFEADGSMAGKGWHQIGGNWYYMYESGVMAANTWIGNHYVDANGVWKK